MNAKSQGHIHLFVFSQEVDYHIASTEIKPSLVVSFLAERLVPGCIRSLGIGNI